MEPRALHVLGQHCITEPHTQPLKDTFYQKLRALGLSCVCAPLALGAGAKTSLDKGLEVRLSGRCWSHIHKALSSIPGVGKEEDGRVKWECDHC